MVATFGIGLIGSEAQAVLVAQFLADGFVDVVDRLVLGHFEEAPAGLLRELLHHLFAVGVTVAAATTADASAPAGIAAASTAGVPSTRITSTGIASATRVASARIASSRIPCTM